ncbi:MAG: glutamine--tRNA ligase, partial [Burkholderiaceae bacterium]|nr:glutamine--tRNA ligase [Burkholderiaceae bacterium]
FRLSPGGLVRLRYAYVVRATAVKKDDAGRIVAVHAEYLPDTKSGTPGASRVKTRAAIHWLPVHAAVPAEVRLYDRLFVDPQPDAGDKDFLALLNPDSRTVLEAFVEPALADAQPDDKFQFERNGYFVADRKDHTRTRPVFNLAVTLKESWGR